MKQIELLFLEDRDKETIRRRFAEVSNDLGTFGLAIGTLYVHRAALERAFGRVPKAVKVTVVAVEV